MSETFTSLITHACSASISSLYRERTYSFLKCWQNSLKPILFPWVKYENFAHFAIGLVTKLFVHFSISQVPKNCPLFHRPFSHRNILRFCYSLDKMPKLRPVSSMVNNTNTLSIEYFFIGILAKYLATLSLCQNSIQSSKDLFSKLWTKFSIGRKLWSFIHIRNSGHYSIS